MRFSRKHLMLILLLFSLVVTACGGTSSDYDSGNSSLEGAKSQRDTAIPQNTATANEEAENREVSDNAMSVNTAPATIENPWGLEDTLVYTRDNTLYLWDFAQHTEPQALARDIDEQNVMHIPAQNSVLFGAWGGSSFFINSLDLASYEIKQIIEVGRSSAPGREVFWNAGSWSPDGQWFILWAWDFDIRLGIAAADGTGYLIKIDEDITDTLWTIDNELVLVIADFSAMGRSDAPPVSQITEIIKVDPATDGRVDISNTVDIELLNNATDYSEQFELLRQELATSGLELAYFSPLPPEDEDNAEAEVEPETFYFVQYPEDMFERNFNGAPIYCREWNIIKWETRNGASPYAEDVDLSRAEILYSDDQVAVINGLANLADGSVLFLRVYYPNCEYGTPVGELIHMMPDGEFEILSNALVHAGDSSILQGWLQGTRFVIAPDLKHAVWLESDGIGLTNTLHVTDLTTDANDTLTVDGQAIEGIVSLFWFANAEETKPPE